MRIGMVGLQSRHLDFFAQQINLEKRFPGVEVTGIWGDDEPQRLPDIARALEIPCICASVAELFDICDTVFVLPRNGYTHMGYARAAQAAGKNLFVDKPFALSAADADELIRCADEQGLALCGGSSLCYLPEIATLSQKASSSPLALISFSADPASPYGGWVYYGSHLCDLCARICGAGAKSVFAYCSGKSVTAVVSYPDRQVVLHSDPARKRPEVLLAEDGWYVQSLDDAVCFRYGLENYIRELANHSTQSHARLRFSALLQDACLRSLACGRPVPLA